MRDPLPEPPAPNGVLFIPHPAPPISDEDLKMLGTPERMIPLARDPRPSCKKCHGTGRLGRVAGKWKACPCTQ